jgi:hypothetical protein
VGAPGWGARHGELGPNQRESPHIDRDLLKRRSRHEALEGRISRGVERKARAAAPNRVPGCGPGGRGFESRRSPSRLQTGAALCHRGRAVQSTVPAPLPCAAWFSLGTVSDCVAHLRESLDLQAFRGEIHRCRQPLTPAQAASSSELGPDLGPKAARYPGSGSRDSAVGDVPSSSFTRAGYSSRRFRLSSCW